MGGRIEGLGITAVRLVVMAIYAAIIGAGYGAVYFLYGWGIWPIGMLISIVLFVPALMVVFMTLATILSGIGMLVLGTERKGY